MEQLLSGMAEAGMHYSVVFSFSMSLSVVVVSSTRGNINTPIFKVINKTVFLINPAAVFTLEISFQCLRLADPLHCAISFNVLDQQINTFQGFLS